MPVGATQDAFRDAARDDGVELVGQRVEWLNQRGHLGLPPGAQFASVRATLESIYVALGGDLATLATARTTPLRGDFLHVDSGTLIEVDESQHFTSARLRSLQLYLPDAPLGFDHGRYTDLCETWRDRSDNFYRTKAARGFGIGGRQRQRAYYDALRDLATPAAGHPVLIRIDAADRDGADAYRRHRDRLRAALGR
ncbi:hypothetical protein H7I41_27630 [Mycobacterium manitobense]|uniref:Uncharacterized protein n=1 Tax=[Mycobacterium] manitobense TaxID=190147 RepID=A0A9X3BQG6_9MYCO|nr:hypothetical protein [[Mycobacterium] manitobense]MCV7173699.1 hypothetical protein [[Mycobacterium] manitobense]